MKVQRRILIQRNVIMFIYSRKIWVISVRGHPSPSSYYFYAQSPWLKCLIMVLLILKYLSFSYSSYVCLMLFRFWSLIVYVLLHCALKLMQDKFCVDYIIYIFSLLHYFCHGKYVWTRKHVARLKKRSFFIIVYGINVQE